MKKPAVQTILVVDDDPEELASTCKVLGAQYPVLAATSGEDALRSARLSSPAVIILDVMMPGGKDGFTVFHELYKDPATRDIPVIFLTGVNQSSGLAFESAEFEKYLGAKPAAFLEKPVRPDDLMGTVAKALSRKARAG